jgi:hypothetical protein
LPGRPIVHHTSFAPIRIAFDDVLGRLSYGLFLLPLPAAWAFDYFVGQARGRHDRPASYPDCRGRPVRIRHVHDRTVGMTVAKMITAA